MEGPGRDGEVGGRKAAKVRRSVRELFEGELEDPERRGSAVALEVDSGGRELDQALEVTALVPLGVAPDLFPVLVGFEEPPLAERGEPARETVRLGGRGAGQAFGRAERIRSISSTSTKPSIRLTTFPEPSTKRTVG